MTSQEAAAGATDAADSTITREQWKVRPGRPWRPISTRDRSWRSAPGSRCSRRTFSLSSRRRRRARRASVRTPSAARSAPSSAAGWATSSAASASTSTTCSSTRRHPAASRSPVNPPMLFVGTFVVGVAVGADVPDLARPGRRVLAVEGARQAARPDPGGVERRADVVLLLALVLPRSDCSGIRIVFLHLFVVAIVTWALRRGITESATLEGGVRRGARPRRRSRELFRGPNSAPWSGPRRSTLLGHRGRHGRDLHAVHRQDLGAGSQAAERRVVLRRASRIGIVATSSLFMRLADRGHRHAQADVGHRRAHAGRRRTRCTWCCRSPCR